MIFSSKYLVVIPRTWELSESLSSFVGHTAALVVDTEGMKLFLDNARHPVSDGDTSKNETYRGWL
jgi:hypothetical protein